MRAWFRRKPKDELVVTYREMDVPPISSTPVPIVPEPEPLEDPSWDRWDRWVASSSGHDLSPIRTTDGGVSRSCACGWSAACESDDEVRAKHRQHRERSK